MTHTCYRSKIYHQPPPPHLSSSWQNTDIKLTWNYYFYHSCRVCNGIQPQHILTMDERSAQLLSPVADTTWITEIIVSSQLLPMLSHTGPLYEYQKAAFHWSSNIEIIGVFVTLANWNFSTNKHRLYATTTKANEAMKLWNREIEPGCGLLRKWNVKNHFKHNTAKMTASRKLYDYFIWTVRWLLTST